MRIFGRGSKSTDDALTMVITILGASDAEHIPGADRKETDMDAGVPASVDGVTLHVHKLFCRVCCR